MTITRRQFIQSVPTVRANFAVAGRFVLDQSPAHAQGAAPLKELKIMADAGQVACDMEQFQFLDEQDDFDSIHSSLVHQFNLNNNDGLSQVVPGICRVRGRNLPDNSFVLPS